MKPIDTHWPPDGVKDLGQKGVKTSPSKTTYPSLAEALRKAGLK